MFYVIVKETIINQKKLKKDQMKPIWPEHMKGANTSVNDAIQVKLTNCRISRIISPQVIHILE